jgi:glycosyltransferase involved in cell wall biosynthesis
MSHPKIKILYLHNISQISGGERSLLNLWENLDRNRFEPILIVPDEGELSKAAKRMGIGVAFLEVPQLSPLNMIPIFKAASGLSNFIRLQRINVIHSYSPRNNILSAMVGKLSNVPVIWHERNLIYGNEVDRSKQFFALADRIICNSKAVAKRFNGINDTSKVRVIINGVNIGQFRPQEQGELKHKLKLDGFKIVGMVANLNKRKRVSFLIEIAALVIKQYTDVRFLIVGGEFPSEGGRQLKDLQDQAERLGVKDHVLFTGFQDNVGPYLNVMDVFVHVTEKEACSRAILEAMACAKPVLAVNEGGNSELIDDNKTGLLIDALDKERFAKEIIALLNDPSKCLTMGQEGRQRVINLFDVKTNAEATQNVYLEFHA